MRRAFSLAAAVWLLASVPKIESALPSVEEIFPKDESPMQWIENLADYPLMWQSPHRWMTITYDGTIECEYYLIDTRAPGLIFSNDSFFNYRDTNLIRLWLGDRLFFMVDEQDDRGFDPADKPFHSEFQQYFVRYTPFDKPWVNVQAGKFATPVGNFVQRHETFDNPLIRRPMPYDFMTVLGDGKPVPSKAALLTRRDLPDKKDKWIPMIWGPVYHTGVEAFGTVDKFEYAFAVANAALSSRPSQWDIDSKNDDHFNYSGRIGCSPLIGLNLGASYAIGPYLKRSAGKMTLTTPKVDVEDYMQETFGFDANFSAGRWQFWGEFYATDWEVPNIHGDLKAYSYYLETRYKFTPKFYGSLRWGQIFFDGGWDRDAWRTEIGFGYYFARNLLGKIEYEHNDQTGKIEQGANMVSMQLVLKM